MAALFKIEAEISGFEPKRRAPGTVAPALANLKDNLTAAFAIHQLQELARRRDPLQPLALAGPSANLRTTADWK